MTDDFDAPLAAPASGGVRQPAPGDFHRDARGTPWVSCPTGAIVKSGERAGLAKLVPYGRPSGLGYQAENSAALNTYKERQIAYGLAQPDGDLEALLAMLADLLSEHGPDGGEAKRAADRVIVRARQLAKASLAADRGTHIHDATEAVDLGENWLAKAERGVDLGLDRTVQHAMVDAWQGMLDAYGLVPLAVEARVVHDGWRQAGTLDRIVRAGRDIRFANGVVIEAGTVLVLDVKTGKLTVSGGAIRYWHSYNCQLAAYAGAVPYDPDELARGVWDWPIDQSWALIAHLPVGEALAGTATCRLVLADLDAGRWAVDEVVMRAKAWQARKDLFALPDGAEPTVELPVRARPALQSVSHDWGSSPPPRPAVADEGDSITDAQVAELKARAAALDPQAKAVLDALAKAAQAADRPFSIGAGANRRRWHIYRALLRLAALFGAELEDDLIRATLALVLPEVAQPAVPLGAAIGSLSVEEAQRFVQATITVVEALPPLSFAEDGAPRWEGIEEVAS